MSQSVNELVIRKIGHVSKISLSLVISHCICKITGMIKVPLAVIRHICQLQLTLLEGDPLDAFLISVTLNKLLLHTFSSLSQREVDLVNFKGSKLHLRLMPGSSIIELNEVERKHVRFGGYDSMSASFK